MNVGDLGCEEFVQRIAIRPLRLPEIGTMAVTGNQHDAVDLLVVDQIEDLIALLAERFPCPGVLASLIRQVMPHGPGAEHLELSRGLRQSLQQPLFLLFSQHRVAGVLLVLLIRTVDSPVQHEDLDIPHREVVPGAGRLGIVTIERIVPVLLEHLQVRQFPRGRFTRSTGTVVHANVMVVPHAIDGSLRNELAILLPEHSPVVMKPLHVTTVGCIDVDVVAKSQVGQRPGPCHRSPDALLLRHISRSRTKGKCVAFLHVLRGIGFEAERRVCDRLSI